MHAHQVVQPKVGPAAALRVHPREQLVQGVAWAETPRAPPAIWQPDYARRYALPTPPVAPAAARLRVSAEQ